jgi:4-amino-4-deoxy-L-arabinose transferase-like glycosyltransferase
MFYLPVCASTPPVRKPVIFCAVGLFAVLTHLIFVFVALPARWRVNQSTDYFEVYQPVARNLLAGNGFAGNDGKPAVQYPPGFSLFLAGSFRAAEALGVDEDLSVRIGIAASVAATGLLVYALAARVFGWCCGLLASILWSIYPLHLWLSKQPDSGQPFTVVFLLAIYLLWLSCTEERGAYRNIFGTGVLVGVASLLRPFGIGLSVPFLLYMWLFATRTNRRLALAALLLAGNLATVFPWEMWAHNATGRWIPLSTNGPASMLDGITLSAVRKPLTVSVSSDVRELIDIFVREGRGRTTGALLQLVAREAVQHPVAAAKLFILKAARCWYANDSGQSEAGIALVQAPYLLLGFSGMLWTRRGSKGGSAQFKLLALVCVLYFWVMSTIALSIVRYMLPVMAILVISGASALSGWFQSPRTGRVLRGNRQ